MGGASLGMAAQAADPVIEVVDADEEDVGRRRGQVGSKQKCEDSGQEFHGE